ncbi:MAG TPA: transaldolase family protein [Solirubrobacteraceae bacterium]|nr:transaldolase family protein [Solirubrobacteraceae bacterium]
MTDISAPSATSTLQRSTEAFPATALWNDSADPDELARSIAFGAVGATCNPVIAYSVISRNLDVWAPRIREIAAAHPAWGESAIGWRAVEELSIEAARLLEPAFRASAGRNGRLSIQTDPRLHRDAEALTDQAERFSQLAENIIVKLPATSVGIRAIEEATYRGVSVNVTVSFTVSQAVAAAQAIERGLDRRAADGLPEREFGAVVTLMAGRLDDWLKQVAARQRVDLPPGYLDWAGVAALKRAYAIFVARGYRARILAAAFRNTLPWSELLGGDLVISPPFDWQLLINENALAVEARIDRPVDPLIIATLSERLGEFRRAYELDGMTPAQFDDFGATRATLRQFLDADAKLDALVRDIIVPAA